MAREEVRDSEDRAATFAGFFSGIFLLLAGGNHAGHDATAQRRWNERQQRDCN